MENKKIKIAVAGTGYVGLSIATLLLSLIHISSSEPMLDFGAEGATASPTSPSFFAVCLQILPPLGLYF